MGKVSRLEDPGSGIEVSSGTFKGLECFPRREISSSRKILAEPRISVWGSQVSGNRPRSDQEVLGLVILGFLLPSRTGGFSLCL